MSKYVEKFPVIHWQGLPVVWDSRQVVSGDHWCVLLLDRKEHHSELSRRPGSRSVGQDSKNDIQAENPGRWLAERASEHFQEPSLGLSIYGITGTNGKTTSAAMTRHLLARLHPDEKVADLGTLGLRVWQGPKLLENFETGFTTPEGPTLHGMMRRLLNQGVRHLVMEVSSHALVLGRVGGVHFTAVGFSNLSQDHLDFHGSMEAYFSAKQLLFTDYLQASRKPERWCAIHSMRPWGQRLIASLGLSTEVHAFEMGVSSHCESRGLQGLELKDARFEKAFKIPMLGAFNAENALLALMLVSRGGSMEVQHNVFCDFEGVPGRLEIVSEPGFPTVVVDYAHTPDALKRALGNLKSVLSSDQKMWCVFGCGGDRDSSKRPQMGAIAESRADHVVLCSDNPRGEDPSGILQQIAAGFQKWDPKRHRQVLDRRQAIELVVREALPDDVILLAGKGHENTQEIQGVKTPFHDPTVVRAVLADFKRDRNS